MARLGEDHQAAVAVQVDEAGRDDPVRGVDPAPDVLGEWRVRGEQPHPVALDEDRAGPAGAPVPSTIVPPVITRSTLSVTSDLAAWRAGPPGDGRGPRRRGPCRGASGRSGGWRGRPGRRPRRPATGATNDGSTAIRSASLPASSEPIDVVEARGPARRRASRAAASRAAPGRGPPRRRPRGARSGRRTRSASP